MMCTQDDLELADYWVNRLSYWSGQNQHLKNETFRAAMDHPLAFQAVILAYCARWRSQIYGLKDSKEFNHHMDQVNKGIENVGKGSMQIGEDSLVLTYSGLALQEERFGSQGAAEIYVDRAARALRPRTAGKATAEVLLHYVRYMITRPCPTIDPGRRQWLVPFLRRAEELMWEHRTEAFLSMVPERRDAFQMGSPLFPLLSSGPHPSRVPEAKRMYVLQDAPTQYVSRGAALIYITAALWEFRDSPSKTRRFLTHLFALANEHRLDRDPACETFVWLLLEETCSMDLRSRERAWSTGELLNISKELPSGLQFRFNEILMGFLQWMIPIPGLDVFEGEVQKA